MQADWSIVERGWQAHILGEAPDTFTDAVDAVKAQRTKSGDPEKPVSDQFLDPFVIVDSAGSPVGPVQVRTFYITEPCAPQTLPRQCLAWRTMRRDACWGCMSLEQCALGRYLGTRISGL